MKNINGIIINNDIRKNYKSLYNDIFLTDDKFNDINIKGIDLACASVVNVPNRNFRKRNIDIIRKYYGLDGKRVSLDMLVDEYGLGRKYIKQIIKNTMTKFMIEFRLKIILTGYDIKEDEHVEIFRIMNLSPEEREQELKKQHEEELIRQHEYKMERQRTINEKWALEIKSYPKLTFTMKGFNLEKSFSFRILNILRRLASDNHVCQDNLNDLNYLRSIPMDTLYKQPNCGIKTIVEICDKLNRLNELLKYISDKGDKNELKRYEKYIKKIL